MMKPGNLFRSYSDKTSTGRRQCIGVASSNLSRAPSFCFAGSRSINTADSGYQLEHLILPGDIVSVTSSGNALMEIGITGGFMGHVLVVVGRPRRVWHQSEEAFSLRPAWPRGAPEVWMVPTIESCRGEHGLSHAQLILHVEQRTGKLILLGSLVIRGPCRELQLHDNHDIEFWQSPGELRMNMRSDLISQVVSEMEACTADWSYFTAARALFQSPDTFSSSSNQKILKELQACWESEPICTSVAIIFWQRYLCKLAHITGSSPSDLVVRWMPLKADRALPGALLSTIGNCGWVSISHAHDQLSHVLPPQQHAIKHAIASRHYSFGGA